MRYVDTNRGPVKILERHLIDGFSVFVIFINRIAMGRSMLIDQQIVGRKLKAQLSLSFFM
ncbi:hypothetical protein D3C73_1511730 [compost metagenome]